MNFDMNDAIDNEVEKMEKKLVFWIITIAVLFISGIALISAQDHDNLFESLKVKVDLEGDIHKIKYSNNSCKIILRNYEDDLLYSVEIEHKYYKKLPELKVDQFIRIKGILPDKYEKRKVAARRLEV